MDGKKRLINYVSTYIMPKAFQKSKAVAILANHLFKKLNIVEENEDKIKLLLLSLSPIPPFVNRDLIGLNSIDDEMVTEVLNCYIADGGIREFKDILDPDTEEPISDSEDEVDNEVDNKYIHPLHIDSDSEE